MAVTWQNVQTVVGRDLTTPEQAQATLWIADARTIISGRAAREHLTLDDLDPATLDLVVREVVAARVQRPGGQATQVSVSVDDGQVSRTWEKTSGHLDIGDEWWELLFPDTADAAYSIAPAYQPDCHSPLYEPSRHPGRAPGWDHLNAW